MKAIQGFLGLIFGIIIFILLLSKIRMIFISNWALVFFFLLSCLIGVIIAKIISWLIVILLVLAAVVFIYTKLSKDTE